MKLNCSQGLATPVNRHPKTKGKYSSALNPLWVGFESTKQTLPCYLPDGSQFMGEAQVEGEMVYLHKYGDLWFKVVNTEDFCKDRNSLQKGYLIKIDE